MRINFRDTSLFLFLFVYSLWDVYHLAYGKIFDIMGFIFSVLIMLTIGAVRFPRKSLQLLFLIMLLGLGTMIVSPASGMSVVMGSFTTLVGATLFTQCSSKVIGSVLLVLIFSQVVDLLGFHVFSYNVSFFPESMFLSPRNNSIEFFRPVGLFSEANAFASTLLLLVIAMLALEQNKQHFVLRLAPVASFMSLSVFGIGASMIQATFIYSKRLLLVGGLFAVFLVSLLLGDELTILAYRLENFTQDPSFIARFGLNSNFDSFLLIPRGFDPASSGKIGANAMIFLLYALGIFAFPFLFLILVYINNPRAVFLFLVSLLTYQYFTTQLFYLIFGLIIGNYHWAKSR